MSQNITHPCGHYPPAQKFIFNTVAYQKSANAVYANMSTIGLKQFKDDRSRMQYLLGKSAVDPNACNAASNCTVTQ
jgi:hypothetical protein